MIEHKKRAALLTELPQIVQTVQKKEPKVE